MYVYCIQYSRVLFRLLMRHILSTGFFGFRLSLLKRLVSVAVWSFQLFSFGNSFVESSEQAVRNRNLKPMKMIANACEKGKPDSPLKMTIFHNYRAWPAGTVFSFRKPDSLTTLLRFSMKCFQQSLPTGCLVVNPKFWNAQKNLCDYFRSSQLLQLPSSKLT